MVARSRDVPEPSSPTSGDFGRSPGVVLATAAPVDRTAAVTGAPPPRGRRSPSRMPDSNPPDPSVVSSTPNAQRRRRRNVAPIRRSYPLRVQSIFPILTAGRRPEIRPDDPNYGRCRSRPTAPRTAPVPDAAARPPRPERDATGRRTPESARFGRSNSSRRQPVTRPSPGPLPPERRGRGRFAAGSRSRGVAPHAGADGRRKYNIRNTTANVSYIV